MRERRSSSFVFQSRNTAFSSLFDFLSDSWILYCYINIYKHRDLWTGHGYTAIYLIKPVKAVYALMISNCESQSEFLHFGREHETTDWFLTVAETRSGFKRAWTETQHLGFAILLLFFHLIIYVNIILIDRHRLYSAVIFRQRGIIIIHEAFKVVYVVMTSNDKA